MSLSEFNAYWLYLGYDGHNPAGFSETKPNTRPLYAIYRTKMRNLIFTFSFLLWASTTQAQVSLDSLWNVWEDQTQPDTTRLKAIGNYTIEGYLYTKPDSAFYFSQLRYDFAKSRGLKEQMANALYFQGLSSYYTGDYTKALECLKESRAIEEEVGNKKGVANSFLLAGLVCNHQGNYPISLEYYQNSLAIYKEIDNKLGIANAVGNIGLIYSDQGNYPEALKYFQKSLVAQEEVGNKAGIANALTNIGGIYYKQGNASKALEYFKKCLAIREEIDEKIGIANDLYNIGTAYSMLGNLSEALRCFQNSQAMFEDIGDKSGIALSFSSIGIIYSQQGNSSEALEYLKKSLALLEEIGDKNQIAYTLHDIGIIYEEQENYPKALKFCLKSLELAQEIKILEEQKNACECLYYTYKSMGKGSEALVYLEKMRAIEDSLYAEETTKKLEQMEFEKIMLQDSIAKVEEARLVQEAHEAEMHKEQKTRNIAFVLGAFILLMAIGIYSRLRYVRKSKVIIEKEKERSENLLLNILPEEIAQELKEKGKADARDFDMVSILFTDFKSFTEQSAKLSATDLVNEINHCFEAFDSIMEKYGIEKIKTIGDAYMAAGGLPVPSNDSVKNTVLAALEMQSFVKKRKAENDAAGKSAFEMRVGIHTGPVVAGIVGVKKFQYDIWGDTVNTASRMESSGEVGKVNISLSTYQLLKDDADLTFEKRGKIEVKGKGEIEMYFVSKP